MLVPAILYKTEIEKNFLKEIYTKNFFYYSGRAGDVTPPEIRLKENLYQYAILNNKEKLKLIGYFSYYIDRELDCVYNFGLYSFDKGNYLIGKNVFEEMEDLTTKFHRIEWRLVGGNPAKKSYDRFCMKHNGNIITLHDALKDPEGNYCNEYIYEIINNEKKI